MLAIHPYQPNRQRMAHRSMKTCSANMNFPLMVFPNDTDGESRFRERTELSSVGDRDKGQLDSAGSLCAPSLWMWPLPLQTSFAHLETSQFQADVFNDLEFGREFLSSLQPPLAEYRILNGFGVSARGQINKRNPSLCPVIVYFTVGCFAECFQSTEGHCRSSPAERIP